MKRTTKKKAFTFIAVFFFCMLAVAVALMLGGCKMPVAKKSNFDKAVDSCIAAGGVPIISRWSATVDDCIFAPGVKK